MKLKWDFGMKMRNLEDPYEAIRQAYLVGMDTESEPFEGEAETPKSSHIVAPPTCHVEESKGSGTSNARSTTRRMDVHVPPAISPRLSVSIAEVTAMSDSAFRKRFRSSYDSSPSPTFLVQKRYRDSKSEDAKEEGPTAKDEDPAVGDEALVVETAVSEPLGLGCGALRRQEIALGEGQMPGVFEVGQSFGFVLESKRPERVSALRQLTLTTWTDPGDGMVYVDVSAYPPPAPPGQTPPSPEWTSGSFPISPSPSIIPSPMISLTVPSPRHVLALEAWAGRVDTQMAEMSRAEYDDHRLIHDMLLQQAALQRAA
uniref:Uncharacterized protein n=1 Tax=Tanacetum cinerariifolium TaxID=118510 RepID=A0A6L2L2M4_TANCI|nr:hypothetical protein [Tanacetum cinerariifolium]